MHDVFSILGEVIQGQYRVDAVAGEGGFGVVYRGHHLGFDQAIAIKCLKVPTHFTSDARAGFLAKFREEGKILAKLSQHPSIVRVFDLGVVEAKAGPLPYLILEWLEGRTLEEEIQARRVAGLQGLGEREAIALLLPAVQALGAAHRLGVAHRDIKPPNLFVCRTPLGDTVKVLDFGIAKAMAEGDTASRAMTDLGAVRAFSPHYGAPEQFWPKRYGATGPWTDVHAMGLLLAELTSGRAPYEGDDLPELMQASIGAARPTPRALGATVSDGFEALCERALALEPKQRFASASELEAGLVQVASGVAVVTPRAAARVAGVGPAVARTQVMEAGARVGQTERPAQSVARPAPGRSMPATELLGSEAAPRLREPSAPDPRGEATRRLPTLALPLVGVAALVVAVVIVAVVWGVSGLSGEPEGGRAAAEPSEVAGAEPASEVAVPDPRPPAAPEWIPFSPNDPLPEPIRTVREAELAGLFREVATGGSAARFTREQSSLRDRVTTYTGRPPEGTTPRDIARAQLLLGHILTDKRNFTDAFERYNAALATDPDAKNDPSLLPDLLVMVGANSAHLSTRAAGRVSVIYGREALPELEATIERTRDAAQRGRLERLRDRIVSESP